jgi:hypothetical protein
MKCKNCDKEIDPTEFCGYCGKKVLFDYSSEVFSEVYSDLSNNSGNVDNNLLLSEQYKKFLKEQYNQSDNFNYLMKSCNIVGYNIRMTESFFGEAKNVLLPTQALQLISSRKPNKLAEYFDNNRKTITPGRDFFNSYSIINPTNIAIIFQIISDDFIEFIKKYLQKDTLAEELIEVILSNMSYGYFFKTAEDIINCKKTS